MRQTGTSRVLSSREILSTLEGRWNRINAAMESIRCVNYLVRVFLICQGRSTAFHLCFQFVAAANTWSLDRSARSTRNLSAYDKSYAARSPTIRFHARKLKSWNGDLCSLLRVSLFLFQCTLIKRRYFISTREKIADG